MIYQSPTTIKGQVVIPKPVRDMLGIKPRQNVVFSVDKKKQKASIEPAEDILDLAGYFKPKKVISALKARKLFEKHYERF
ncbi:AbrB/MazE/SpoVT family DNA-binding domain-containing protein [Patescibacteria group bacterium]|nr:AbrB/MazE/SpoVT family DNA-binding domain-containing protein [Patescibacteria group bacterium]